MEFSFFVGIDISKKTLDFAVRNQKQLLFHARVDNSPTGLAQFKKECLARNINLQECLICCEHTGIYSGRRCGQNILALATQDNLSLWLESSLRIKKSLGLQRGKNDKIDAIRISEYAFRFKDKTLVWQPERQVVVKLRQLVALRKRLLNAKSALKVPLDEGADFQDKKLQKEMEKLNRKPVEAVEKQIAEVERKIRSLIREANAARMILFPIYSTWLLLWME